MHALKRLKAYGLHARTLWGVTPTTFIAQVT